MYAMRNLFVGMLLLACAGSSDDASAGEGTGILVRWHRDSRWTYCEYSDSFVLTLKGFQICPGTD